MILTGIFLQKEAMLKVRERDMELQAKDLFILM